MLRFFKSKVKPNPDFATIEVEYNGVLYGYILNWFKKDSNGIMEVRIPDLPEGLINYNVNSMLNRASRDLSNILIEYEKSLRERIAKLDEIIARSTSEE